MLDQAFIYYPTTIDEYSLAFYFAYLLKDDFAQLYLQAAKEGKLRVSNWPLSHSKLMSPGSIEPTGISDQEEAYQEILWRMKNKLDEQLQKKKFWIIDETWLEDLGQMVVDLATEKIALLAGYFE